MKNKTFFKNHKGSKMLSVYWFAILFLVAGAVVYMTILFYGSPYDVREIERNALTMQVADCIAQGGYLKENVLSDEFKENFLEDCNLNLKVEDVYGWKEGSEYYIEVGIYEFDENAARGAGQGVSEIIEGNPNLKIAFDVESDSDVSDFERGFYVLDENGEGYIVSILSLVGKREKNER